jgi:DNA-binding transcriptional ArsR family regulator
MPAPAESIVRPSAAIIEVSTEPVHNALQSLFSIIKAAYLSGFSEWVQETRESLTPAELETNRLVVEGLHYALYPQRHFPDFPAYVDRLEEMDATRLRDRLLDGYFDLPCKRDKPSPYTTYEEVLRTAESYLDFLNGRFGPEHVDEELEKTAYAYATDPPAMQALIVSHLRMMWDRYLAAEWARIEPMLEDSAAAFNEYDLESMSFPEAAEFITGHSQKDKDWDFFEREFQHLVFVPSAHIGPYQARYHQGDTLITVFGARPPVGTRVTAPDLSRNEIVVRLNALADDTRLRILHLIAEQGEQRSQDIINALDLSQSAASRHLKQLSATGYLVERRCEGAKCYSLSEDRLRDTFRAVLAFLAVFE